MVVPAVMRLVNQYQEAQVVALEVFQYQLVPLYQ
jgi:hypothetical protein